MTPNIHTPPPPPPEPSLAAPSSPPKRRPPLVLTTLGACIGAAALLISALMPTGGLGVDLCWFHNLFDLPCPGCGLTRSVVHITHGRWATAWAYNPFGFVAYACFLVAVGHRVAPSRWRRALLSAAERHRRRVDHAITAVLVLMLAFGLLRLVAVAWWGWSLP